MSRKSVSRKLLSPISAGVLLAIPAAQAIADSTLTGSIRIGATYEDNANTDGEVFIRNFGSRLIWTGTRDLGNGTEGIARVELGLNPDNNARGSSGIDRTRQLWAGVRGGLGSIKIGAQYAAFYDLVSGHTDIAWWGSCWTQFECSRETQVLKYNGSVGGLSYAASVQANSDEEEDVADQLEAGFNYALGNFTVGLAASVHADEGDNPGGTLVGGLVKGDLGPASVALTFQMADEDFAGTTDDATNITLAASLGNSYLVHNQGDTGAANPFFTTLGYTLNLSTASLMYFEVQTIDADDGADADIIGRATYKFDW